MSNSLRALALIQIARNIHEGNDADAISTLLLEAETLLQLGDNVVVRDQLHVAEGEPSGAINYPNALRVALGDERWTWRTISALAKAIGRGENETRSILSSMNDVRRAAGTSLELYGLIARNG